MQKNLFFHYLWFNVSLDWKIIYFYFVKVTGALQSEVSTFYLDSWPVHPYRTASALLIRSTFPLSLNNVTSKLNLLVRLIPEVSSVIVQGKDGSEQHRSLCEAFWRHWFSTERCHSCRDLRMIHEAENTVFRKKWLICTTVSFSHLFCLSDSLVFCGMFPVIAENNTTATAHTHICILTPTHWYYGQIIFVTTALKDFCRVCIMNQFQIQHSYLDSIFDLL